MSIPVQTADAEDFLASKMRHYSAAVNVTKRSAARLAIALAISNGFLPEGCLIPTEKRLTIILGISLGTVQAALQQLQQSGIIIRRRGDGSRVASTEALGSETWHFRLLSKDTGAALRVSSVDVDVEVTTRRGPWSKFFTEYSEFILIRRRLIMSKSVAIGAEMLLPEKLVPGMKDLPPDELKMVNIRSFIAEKHGLLVSKAEHQIETVFIDDLDTKRMKLAPGSLSFQITANAFFQDNTPGYWQRIIVPSSDCRVTF